MCTIFILPAALFKFTASAFNFSISFVSSFSFFFLFQLFDFSLHLVLCCSHAPIAQVNFSKTGLFALPYHISHYVYFLCCIFCFLNMICNKEQEIISCIFISYKLLKISFKKSIRCPLLTLDIHSFLTSFYLVLGR